MALYSFHGQIIGRGKSIRMSKDGSVSEKADSQPAPDLRRGCGFTALAEPYGVWEYSLPICQG